MSVCVRQSLFNRQAGLEAVIQQPTPGQFTFLFTLHCETRTVKFMVISARRKERQFTIIRLSASNETHIKFVIK